MSDQPDRPSKPARSVPPPFIGPPRAGSLAPKARADRPTLPPFSPPFVKRPSPAVPVSRQAVETKTKVDPPWLDATPNDPREATATPAEVPAGWVNPDAATAAPPPQAATGIEWLDSPTVEPGAPLAPRRSPADDEDPFGWDPAEERPGALNTAPSGGTLDALKEIEPWALPGVETGAGGSDDVAAALERVAARIRSGDLFVPASAATTDEALLASVLAALLQRSRG